MKEEKRFLSKALGRTDVIALGVGAIIGWSWVIMTSGWITEAGMLGAVIAFIIGAVIIAFIGMIYGELTSAMPITGGEVIFGCRAMGPLFGWISGWTLTFAFLGVAAWEGIAIATAIDSLFPIPKLIYLWDIAGYPVYLSWALIGAGCAVCIMLLNLFNNKPAILFQVMGTAALIIVGLVILFGGIAQGSMDNVDHLFTDRSGFFSVLIVVPSMLIGFEVISQSSEEINLKNREIGKMALVCILLATAWYLLVIVGCALAAPMEVRTSAILPVADIMAYAFNSSSFRFLVVIAGIMGILTSWNAFFIAAIRLIYAMGRIRLIPASFMKLSPKYNTPSGAIIFVGVLCAMAPFLGRNALSWFVDTSSLCALVAYFLVTLFYLVLHFKEPELPRPFRIRFGLFFGIVILIGIAVYIGLYFVNMLTETYQWATMVIVAVWFAIGIAMYIYSSGSRKAIPAQRYEILVFGERYARKLEDRKQ